jgi:hypothetical protein
MNIWSRMVQRPVECLSRRWHVAVLVTVATACDSPPAKPPTASTETAPTVVAQTSTTASSAPPIGRAVGASERRVRGLWDTLPPEVSGGWEGAPIKLSDPPPLPAGWDGLALEYHGGARADEAWYLERDGTRLINEDRRRVIRTYLVWHAPSEEGIIINPIARDSSFVIELARRQPSIRWRFVIDTVTQAPDSPKLSGKAWGLWRDQVKFKGQSAGFRDYEKPWRDKVDVVEAAAVASALGAKVIARGLTEPEALRADKLLVFRSHMDVPHDRTLKVEWGPFEFASDWKD